MHSRRMHTVRSSNHVYPSMHWAGGVYPSIHWADTPSPHPVNRMAGVKTFPCRNYVANGKNPLSVIFRDQYIKIVPQICFQVLHLLVAL